MIIEYKTDGSFREFRNHFNRKTKEDLIRELWDWAGTIEKQRKEIESLGLKVAELEANLQGDPAHDISNVF